MTSVEAPASPCERFQHVAAAWLRSGELTRTNHMLSPLEELAGYNYGFVYLLDVDTQSCKIGFSEHPMRRIKELRFSYGERLKLRACFVGEQLRERELHQRFAHLRIQNERFLKSDAIVKAFAEERERVRNRLRALHLCTIECSQIEKRLDLRMLRTWLSR